MREETITLYQFDELDNDAKERARDWWRNTGDCWGWASEWWNSAQAFSRIAPIDIKEADYSRGDVTVKWRGVNYATRYDHDDGVRELSGLRAWKWLQNNGWFEWARQNKSGACTMTGYCGDCAFADPIMEYYAKPNRVPDLEQLFYECAQSWVCEAMRDLEYSYSDESIDETILANEYEFESDGTFYGQPIQRNREDSI